MCITIWLPIIDSYMKSRSKAPLSFYLPSFQNDELFPCDVQKISSYLLKCHYELLDLNILEGCQTLVTLPLLKLKLPLPLANGSFFRLLPDSS